jgi:hypothetical protein
MMKTHFRWVDIYVIGRLFGINNPRHQLKKAITRKEAKQIGRGLYEINRELVRQRRSKKCAQS